MGFIHALLIWSVFSFGCSYKNFEPGYSRSQELSLLLQSEDVVIKLNNAIDTVMDLAHSTFLSDGELSIPLHEIDKPFGHPPYDGQFTAANGYFKNLATLHRTGDVKIVKHDDTVSLEVALGLSEVEAGYDNYTLNILGIRQSGRIKLSIEENSFMMKISLTYSPACTFQLDYVKFNVLKGIKLDISGLGVFQTMFDELSNWLISNFEVPLKTVVNEKLFKTLTKTISKVDICKYFPK